MIKEKLDENKISFLKTGVPMYPDFEPYEIDGEISEETKKQVEKNMTEFLDEYRK